MKVPEIDIRIGRVGELPLHNMVNRWEMMRYNGTGITVSLHSKFLSRPAVGRVVLQLFTRYYYTRAMMRHNLVDYGVEVEFEVSPMSALSADDASPGDIAIPPRLMVLMYSVAIGALRGMLAQKTGATMLAQYPLPLVNVSELVSRHIYGTPVAETTFPFVDFRYN